MDFKEKVQEIFKGQENSLKLDIKKSIPTKLGPFSQKFKVSSQRMRQRLK